MNMNISNRLHFRFVMVHRYLNTTYQASLFWHYVYIAMNAALAPRSGVCLFRAFLHADFLFLVTLCSAGGNFGLE